MTSHVRNDILYSVYSVYMKLPNTVEK